MERLAYIAMLAFQSQGFHPVTKIGEVGETAPDKVEAMMCPVPAEGEENSCEYVD